LRQAWIAKALEEPVYYELQEEDDRIRYWIFVPELGHYLRVVTLEDGYTVHNAFVDPAFRL